MSSEPKQHRSVRDAVQQLTLIPAGILVVGEVDPPRVVLIVKGSPTSQVDLVEMTPQTALALTEQLRRASDAALSEVFYCRDETGEFCPFARVMSVQGHVGHVDVIVPKMVAAGCTHAGICGIDVTFSDPLPPFVTKVFSDGAVVATLRVTAGEKWLAGEPADPMLRPPLLPLDKRFGVELSFGDTGLVLERDVDVTVALDLWGFRKLGRRS